MRDFIDIIVKFLSGIVQDLHDSLSDISVNLSSGVRNFVTWLNSNSLNIYSHGVQFDSGLTYAYLLDAIIMIILLVIMIKIIFSIYNMFSSLIRG